MTSIPLSRRFDRATCGRFADIWAAGMAAALPWSTSLTLIAGVCWLLALLPTLDAASLRRTFTSAAGLLPVALVALGAVGLLWSPAPLGEAVHALGGFYKLLAIPLLLIHFRRTEHGWWVGTAFLASCVVLLVASFVQIAFPPAVMDARRLPGVVVRDHIAQGTEFMLCAFALTHLALDAWARAARAAALALGGLALLFLANIAFVDPGRTAVAVFPVLVVLICLQRFGWRGSLAVLLAALVLAAAAWQTSATLRQRVESVAGEIRRYVADNAETSSGLRLEFWRKSLAFLGEAPVIGHGTGSIDVMFARAARGQSGAAAAVTGNPHNQTLVVGLQLGLIGIAVLWAMWLVHAALFRGSGLAALIGLGLVVQNVISALFNSILFDFTPGWIYVLGVGVLGGMALARKASDTQA